MAAGTGLVGEHLHKLGFRNIHGVDISPGMLKKAEEKKVYNRLDEMDLADIERFPGFMKNKYDVVTCAGFMNSNYMDRELLEIMLMALKKNGILVVATRFSYMGRYWYDKYFKEMEQEKRWTQLYCEEFYKYNKLQEGIGRFTKTPVKVFAFRKTQDELITYKKPNSLFLGVRYDENLKPYLESPKE